MREYRVWTKEEEHALRLGVAKHGSGAWELIRTDPDFNATLQARSGIQLKDKWRNLVKFNHLSEAELNLGPKSRLQQSRTSQRTPVTPVMADADVIPERPTRHRSRKSNYATTHATTTTHTYTPPPTPSPTQPPAHATPTSAPAVGKISREQALLDHVLQLTDGAAAATGATQPVEQNNNCDDTTRSTPSSASGERKFTAFLGTRSRSSFEAELAADAIAAQILTSVPASMVPAIFDSREDAAETGRKRTCVSPEDGQNANTAAAAAAAAPANEQGSATASAEMSTEKNAGTSVMENQASLQGPLDASQLETNGKNGTYYSPQSKQPLLAAVQHHSRLDASAACPVPAPLSAIHPLRYAEPSTADAPAATAATAAAASRGANPAAAAATATDRSALIALSAAAAAAATAGSPGSTPAGTPPAAPVADLAARPATHAAHASIAAAYGPGLLETTALGCPNSHKNVTPDNQNPHVRASQPKTEPCGSPSTQQGSPNAADDSIATSQPFSAEFNNTTSNNDAHTSDRQQQPHATGAGAATIHRPHPADAAAYPPSNGVTNGVHACAMNPVRSPPALDSSKTTKLTGTSASPPSQAPAATGCGIKSEPHSSQQQPSCVGGIVLQHAGINGLSVDDNGVLYLRGHGVMSGGGGGACTAAGVSGDQEERSGRTAGDTGRADKQSPPPPQVPALLNAAAAATVALSDENAHQDDAGGTARDVLCNGLGHHAAVSCAVAGAADETCMEASCIETPVHAPIPAHVLEKVQGIMARHKYSVLRVLPGGQAQLLAELAKGKQFVYFSPFEVEQMIVVEKTQSDSE